jgi:hypothetical protein
MRPSRGRSNREAGPPRAPSAQDPTPRNHQAGMQLSVFGRGFPSPTRASVYWIPIFELLDEARGFTVFLVNARPRARLPRPCGCPAPGHGARAPPRRTIWTRLSGKRAARHTRRASGPTPAPPQRFKPNGAVRTARPKGGPKCGVQEPLHAPPSRSGPGRWPGVTAPSSGAVGSNSPLPPATHRPPPSR